MREKNLQAGGKATGCGGRWTKEWEETLAIASVWRFYFFMCFFFFNFNQILGSTCSIRDVVELFDVCCAFFFCVCV